MEKTVYLGVNDHSVDLFEGMYKVPNGVSYNSYAVIGEKTAVLDAVDAHFADAWLKNIGARESAPDYIVILHMEPDHSGSVAAFAKAYPHSKIVGNQKTFVMLGEYFPELALDKISDRAITVKDGEKLDLGGRSLTFVFTPMVHWPEVMMAYDDGEKALFSADGFGKFGALDADEEWTDEARRYYIGIVGKYGAQVQSALKKASTLDIKAIRPLHGPVLTGNGIALALEKYGKWSSYTPEEDGVLIAYTSVYGHTKAAAELLKSELDRLGVKNEIYDLARCDGAEAVARAFMYSKLVIATTTYNADAFPSAREFADHLAERNFQNRKIAIIENGSWAPTAANAIKARLEKCKNLEYVAEPIKVRAALDETSAAEIKSLASLLAK